MAWSKDAEKSLAWLLHKDLGERVHLVSQGRARQGHDKDAYLRPEVLGQEDFASLPSRDIWQCPETFLLVITRE